MKAQTLFVTILSVFFFSSSVCLATDLLVPSQYPTIQAAINASVNGDTVIISPGTYTGTGNRDIDFGGKAITVTSTNPQDPCIVAATIINCNGSQANPHRGFYFHTGEGAGSVLDGVTINGGYVYDSNGGGIYCQGASPTIENCVITNNGAYGRTGTSSVPNGGHAYGGGAFCSSGSSAIFLNCKIISNIAYGGLGYGPGKSGNGYGGGISCTSNSNISIINCTVSGNQAHGNSGQADFRLTGFPGSDGYGGGISCTGSNAIINNTVITGNTVLGGNGRNGSLDYHPTPGGLGCGSGIYFDPNSQPTIEDCNILGNTASGGVGGSYGYYDTRNGGNAYGGGIYGSSASGIQNCLITNNSAHGGNGGANSTDSSHYAGTGGDGKGAGMYLPAGAPGIQNCLITNNSASGGNGGDGSGIGGMGGNGGSGKGAGVYCLSNAPIKNSTVVNNTASKGIHGFSFGTPPVDGNGFGGGVYCENSPGIIDTILWGNADSSGTTQSAQIYGGTPAVSYCCTQGGVFTGTGNINANPLFVTGPQGNYYLSQIAAGQAGDSPCVNTGSDTADNLGMNLFTTRIDKVVDHGIVDMGYHYSGAIIIGSPDIDKNFIVDFFDFAILANDWRLNGPNLEGDITGDLHVDFKDLLVLADAWLNCLVQPSSSPNPANGATNVSLTQDLSWTAGSGAGSHDVYFGTVNPPPFMGNQTAATYDTGTMTAGTIYYWQIDEMGPRCTTTGPVRSFTTASLPGAASNPNPADSAVDASPTQDLSWTAGSGATSHDVYFGTANPPPFKVNQVGTTYNTGTMAAGTTYYWRIDEKSIGGTTTGTVWSFTTSSLPTAATNPVPANGNYYIDPNNVVLSWTAGAYTDSHDVYLGTAFSDVNNAGTSSPEFKGNRTSTIYDPCSNLDVNTTYYWRIDEKNITGTTKGNIWNFKTWPAGTDPNLVSWWKFDEGSGTIAYDSARSNNGTINGAATWTTGKIGGALNFDGSNDYVSVPDNDNSLDMPSQMTISAWVKPNSRNNYYEIVAKQPSGTASDGSAGNYDLRIDKTNGLLAFFHQTAAGGTSASYSSTSAVPTGAWQHVAVTVKQGDSVKFYINGAAAGSFPQTTVFGITNDNPLRIGSRKDSWGWFNGPMDDVRIYNRALSATEIQQIYLNP